MARRPSVALVHLASLVSMGGVLLLVAGCSSAVNGTGSTGGTSLHSPPSTSGSSPSRPPGSAGAPATTAQLEGLVLKPADLPSAYAATPSTSTGSGSDAQQAAFAACLGVRDTQSDSVASASSDDFSLAGATISSHAESFRSQADVTVDTSALRSPRIEPCFQTLLKGQVQNSLPSGEMITALRFTVELRPVGFPANLAGLGHATLDITASGQSVVVYADIAFIVGRMIEAEVDFESVGVPVPAALQASLIDRVAARTAAA
jgi:hypothetical protein